MGIAMRRLVAVSKKERKMIKGIYTSASGMLPRMLKQEIFSNNMANVNTTGFKSDDVFMQVLDNASEDLTLTGEPWEKPMVDGIYTEFEQGSLERTDGNKDVALEGSGFFAIETESGEKYTRAGNFSVSAQGILIDGHGNPVLSDSGPIPVIGNDIAIDADGNISVDGANIAKLKVIDFDKPYKLTKTDGGYFAPATSDIVPKAALDCKVRQGYLEKSNVNVIGVMVDMLASFRAYEAGQKAIQSQDETLEKAVTELGRI
jgi:flagellar basal-body rod protein FlgF